MVFQLAEGVAGRPPKWTERGRRMGTAHGRGKQRGETAAPGCAVLRAPGETGRERKQAELKSQGR